MAMFTRRVLQRCIDESFPYASDKARRNWVSKLNSSSEPAYVATEWEVVLLHAMAQLGSMRHEPSLGGTRPIDAVVECDGLSFGADITAISDRGLHERNPVHALEARLEEVYQASGVTQGGIVVSIMDLSFGKRLPNHSIVPPKQEFDKLIFSEKFNEWVSSLLSNPLQRSTYEVIYRNPRSVLRFVYQPGRSGAGLAEYSNYCATQTIEKNTLHNALRSKADQLKKCGFEGLRGIIICDGGADVLRQSFSGAINTDQVVFEFLRRYKSVSFVVIFALRNLDVSTIRRRVESRVFVEREHPWHKNLNNFISQVVTRLPRVVQGPENALSELRFWEGKKRTNLGGMSMTLGETNDSIRELRMSTRTLLDVLSGRLSQAQLNEWYRHGKSKGLFEHIADSGSLIESARVERKPDEDFDEIIFTFGTPDSASSAFRIPNPPHQEE
jgi:hypothetical protein